MPKNKKTLKQKILSDIRQESQSDATNLYSFEHVSIAKEKKGRSIKMPSSLNVATITTDEYNYLVPDLLKTGLFSGLIILLEIVLFNITKGV